MLSSLLLSNLVAGIYTYSEQAKDFLQLLTLAAAVVLFGASLQVDRYFCTPKYHILCRNYHFEQKFKKKNFFYLLLKDKINIQFAVTEIIMPQVELRMYR